MSKYFFCWWCGKTCNDDISFNLPDGAVYLCSKQCVKESCKARMEMCGYDEEIIKVVCD